MEVEKIAKATMKEILFIRKQHSYKFQVTKAKFWTFILLEPEKFWGDTITLGKLTAVHMSPVKSKC